jgi:hypothetical protein
VAFKYGKSSRGIVLPREWLDYYGLTQGNELIVLGNEVLIVAPKELEQTLGIRRWSWSDPGIAPYIPKWIGEVYEGKLDSQELLLVCVLLETPLSF